MKVLYVTDLDGTLLRGNAKTSEYTNKVINELTSKGMLFSYATARSYNTARKVTEGLNAKIPLIVYNGSAILQNETYEIIEKNSFAKEEKDELLFAFLESGVYPIVYSYQDGKEKFSYVKKKCNDFVKEFVLSRKGDARDNPVETETDLGSGEVFYFSCIDTFEKLEPLYERFKRKYNCYFQKGVYIKEQWLEIVPKKVSKANAILQLKELLGVDYIIAFGDGKNDMEMFELADEAYAVENAVDELKAIATGIIGSNDSDGVAKWLVENYKPEF